MTPKNRWPASILKYSCIFFYIIAHHISCAKTPLYIGGTFPLSHRYLRQKMIEMENSAKMAIRDINSRNDILETYEIRLNLKDDRFDKIVAGQVIFDQILYGPQLIALLGPFTSSSASIVAPMARYWNLIQLSVGATSTQFSNRKEYPYFYTSIITDITYNLVRINMVKYFGWQRVAIIYLSDVLFDNGALNLQAELEMRGINIIAKESFVSDPELQIKMLKEKGARIIFTFGYPQNLASIFCHAYKLGMYGENYAWFASNFLQRNWWEATAHGINCTTHEILQAGKGYIAFGQSYISESGLNNKLTVSGLTYRKYFKEYEKFTNGTPRSVSHTPSAYDSIWCLALALNQTDHQLQKYNTSLANFNYNDTRTRKLFNAAMENISFMGLTGPFSFLSGARVGDSNIMQFRGNISAFGLVKVGFYNSSSRELSFNETDRLMWPGGRVPVDGFETKFEENYITCGLFIIVTILSVVGIVTAMAFLLINFRHRELRVIKMSSPRINNLILLGFIFCYADVVLFGVDYGITKQEYLPTVCTVRVGLLCIGFTLSFGAMFAKTWRVHVIFTNKTNTKVVIKDSSLFGITSILLIIDFIILAVWISIDPFINRYQSISSSSSSPGSNIIIQPRTLVCSCQHISVWLGVVYGYKFLLLVFGTFLAWETRNVSIAELNDSRHIGLTIYNAVMFATIGVLVSQLTQTTVNGGYIIISAFILICTTSSMCLFFIPKIQLIRNANFSIISGRPTRPSAIQRPRLSVVNTKIIIPEISKNVSIKQPAEQNL
ncbi:Gamma-aminobutyric acid type B receptor subunit 2 [Trichoplax sp. H2]|nr:Gamma-aminobutyric acid type B receptor subunit 2 [Trichoplax sp. H2]|eukprot:RDD42116.1 Gamma-aminobutyric acid type B receptor subunit 2 [Trichoplax sp. H2]